MSLNANLSMKWDWLVPLVLAAAVLVAGVGVGQWLRGEPSLAAPTSCPYSGGGPAFAMQSFEGDQTRGLVLDALRLAAVNELFPNDEDFMLEPLTVGRQRVEDDFATIPVEVLYAISWRESKTTQAAPEVPWGTLGPALISFDCGYGVMQVTSSLLHDGGLPTRYEALVGTHFAYNVAAGARILSEKWNEELYPIVGNHDPSLLESWYFALWAYNGWAGVNHPAHPSNDQFRQPHDCEGPRNGYPYQELVYACIETPPVVEGRQLWAARDVNLPNWNALSDPGEPLNLDVFYAGLDETYVNAAAVEPFAQMNLAIPQNARPSGAADIVQPGQLRQRILGQPMPRVDNVELELTSTQLASGAVPLMIHNDGSGLLAWRVVEAPSWLSFDVQAGVALGQGYTFADSASASQLRIEAAAGGVPEGEHRDNLKLEFYYPDGRTTTHSVAILLDKRGAAFYEAGRPQS